METIAIRYCFKFEDDTQEIFNLELDANNLEIVGNAPAILPQWTNLDFHQCPHCPLNTNTHPNCPLCVNLANVVRRFDSVLSYDQVQLDVITEERCVSQQTTAQRGISSMLGLVIATCGCPHTVYFKPMARFHLPLSTEEETIYRAASMYMLAQYFLEKKGKTVDVELQGLRQIYINIHLVNSTIVSRLRVASKTDSSINSIIMLDMFAKAMPYVIEEHLDEIRYLFAPYLLSTDTG